MNNLNSVTTKNLKQIASNENSFSLNVTVDSMSLESKNSPAFEARFSTIRFAQPDKDSQYTPKTTGVGCIPQGGGGSPA